MLLDLCCGTGVIGICLSEKVKKVIGIEIIPQAIENAITNLKINGLDKSDKFDF